MDEVNLPSTELTLLLSTLAAAVESFPVDDNSFHSRKDYPDPVDAQVQLVKLAREKQVSPNAFIHSFHDYLDRSLNGPHCVGTESEDLKELVRHYEFFNSTSGAGVQIEPLSIPTSTPPLVSGPDEGEYWLSPKTKELLINAKHLNFDDNWKPYTDADRKTPEWQDRVGHLLNDMDDWNPSDEPDPADYYHQRCVLLYRILAYVPPGTLYDRVVSAWVATFAASSLQWDNPPEWYFEVSKFLEFSKKDKEKPTPAAAIVPLKNSSNSYLHALGVLAEFLQ